MPGPTELDSTLSALAEGQRVFGRYTLGRVLGRGTLGVVWLARDEEKRRNVELKFLPEMLARDVVAVSDLRNEVERVRGLQHETFQAIYDFHEDDGRAAVSSEFVPGNTLGALCEVRLNGCFDAAELLPWIEPLAEAFAHAHEQLRLVHRALHPGHLVLTPAGRVKVLDFGIAHTLLEAAARHAGGMRSSTALTFSSPQLATGSLPLPSDDIYALGATLYDLLAGAPPDLEASANRLPMAERRAVLNRWGASIPPAWETAIAACLAREPAQRPASVAALVKVLREGFVAGRAAESPILKLEPPEVKPAEKLAAAAAPAIPPPQPFTTPVAAPAPPASPVELAVSKAAEPVVQLPKTAPPRTKAPAPLPARAAVTAPVATTLPEVEAAQAITAQRAHHRGALVALVCIGLAVWIARLVAERALPPVLPGAPTPAHVRKTANVAPSSPTVSKVNSEPESPLIAANDSPPPPPIPIPEEEPPAETPDPSVTEVPEAPKPMPATPEPATPTPEAPPAATPAPKPATPAPVVQVPDAPAPVTPVPPAPATPAPKPATPMPASPVPSLPAPDTPIPDTPVPPPPATPAPKPATPMPATPAPATPAPATPEPATTAPPPPDTPKPPPATPMPGPRRAEPVASHEPPKPGEPWTNSLGMPFVPVAKLPILVAIWETRSRDFEVFAKSIALHWKPSKDGPDHPATDLSFRDAIIFCDWLTTTEETAGRIKPGQHYRLPSDAEWSTAAGIAPERGESLRERDEAGDKSYPWGNTWPPPPTAGNFRGLNATNAGASGSSPGDIFPRSAPVGSFVPNRLGFFDMAGNVAEMVSDLIAPELGLHATRGGSYLDGDRRALRLRARGVGEDDHGHVPHIGFRIVLDPGKAE